MVNGLNSNPQQAGSVKVELDRGWSRGSSHEQFSVTLGKWHPAVELNRYRAPISSGILEVAILGNISHGHPIKK